MSILQYPGVITQQAQLIVKFCLYNRKSYSAATHLNNTALKTAIRGNSGIHFIYDTEILGEQVRTNCS